MHRRRVGACNGDRVVEDVGLEDKNVLDADASKITMAEWWRAPSHLDPGRCVGSFGKNIVLHRTFFQRPNINKKGGEGKRFPLVK
jgi:hypothetical protein